MLARRQLFCYLALAALLGARPAAAAPTDTLRTRAERTDYRATSTYDDVMAFVRAIDADPGFHLTTFGETVEGRELPLVIWGADSAYPGDVLGAGTLRVLILANIHAGEVAGKEAALILLRDLAQGRHAAWADSLTLLVAPIYNADGNERIDPGNRPYQHGPVDGMGQRANADGLDLNRDFVKLDAPESRALVRLMNGTYDPHVVIDLHTTNGTVHGYDLTYAPPLHPNTSPAIDSLLREAWLPVVTERYKARTGGDIGYYGNDKPEWGQPRGWATFDPRPRFGTNYAGLQNRVGILSEAYSYATFEDRIEATRAFVTELLEWAHAHAGEVRAVVEAAEAESLVGRPLAMRSARRWLAEPEPEPILLGEVVEEPNPHTGAPMWRRTGAQTPTEMAVYGRFEGAVAERVPEAYLVPLRLADEGPVLGILRDHGVGGMTVEHWNLRPGRWNEPTGGYHIEAFVVDSVHTAPQPFQGHREREVFGRYVDLDTIEGERPVTCEDDRGLASCRFHEPMLVFPMDRPSARLGVMLLEPRSDSGLAGWGLVRGEPGQLYPVLRLVRRAP